MSTNKFPLRHPRRPRFTDEALKLFATLECVSPHDREHWEDDPRPGRRREYLDGSKKLARLLELTTEFWGGCSVVAPGRFQPAPHYAAHQYWATVMRVRRELLEALAEADEAARESEPAAEPARPTP